MKCYNKRIFFCERGSFISMKQQGRGSALKTFSAAILVFIFLFYGCTGSDEKEQVTQKNKEIIKIGVILPFSDLKGYLAEEEKKAIELAVKEINSKNKREIIQLVYADSKENAAEAAIIAEKLLQSANISAFITSTISISRGVLPVATRNKGLIAMLCLDPKIQTMSPYAFRLYNSMADEANQLIEYYSRTKKGKKVVILYLNHADIINEVSHYIIPEFMQKGIDVVYYEPYERAEEDVRGKIERLKHSGANSVMILGFGNEFLPLFKELAQQQLIGKIEITGGWGFLAASTLPPQFAEGVIVACPQYVFLKNAKAGLFEENFTRTYGHAPNLEAAFAYDAANIFAEGLIEGLVEKEGNADTVSFKITNHKYGGVMGDVLVDNEGGFTVPMGIGIIRQGKVLPYNK
jgi:branched-chain amino acid transport system substrate-binding protein